MAIKIGRNDFCPCGSGKKNKKCHNIERMPDIAQSKREEKSSFMDYLKQHDSADLLNAVIGMQLLPENHGKNVRIEEIANAVVNNLNAGNKVAMASLEVLLRSEFPSNHLEDPAENLFTENAAFYQGNHIVFPGIASHPNDVFLQLTQVIYNTSVALPDAFRARVYQGITLLLQLGNRAAALAGLSGNLEGIDTGKALKLPEAHIDFSLSVVELAELCSEWEIDPRAINDFILTEERENLDNGDPTFSPLLYYPVISFDKRFYYLLISNQLNTLNEYIFRMATHFGCQRELLEAYRKEVWGHVQLACNDMGWGLTDIGLPEFGEGNAPVEAIFQSDVNRLAYVVLDTPLKIPNIYENPGTELRPDNIYKRMDDVLSDLKARENLKDSQFLMLHLHDSCGRMYLGRVEKPKDRDYRLPFAVPDFLTLAKGEDWDRHSLWKFSKAFCNFMDKTQTMSGIMELYSMYKQKSSSFYFSDDAIPDFLTVVPGEGSELLREAKLKENYHAAPFIDNGTLGFFPVVSCGDFAPIYKPIRPIGYFIESLEGYRSPLWMTNHQVKSEKMAVIVRLYSNALSFWLHKMKPVLKDILDPYLDVPLTIRLELHPAIFDEMPSGELHTLSDEEYTSAYSDGILDFRIPSTSLKSFSGAQNEGERHLIKKFLEGLSLMGVPEITSELIEKSINIHMPLGQAKMILLSDSQNDMMIDRRWLPEAFLMSDAEIEALLDELPAWIQERIEIPKQIITKQDKLNLFNTGTAVLLEHLDSELQKYSFQPLITLLLELHEAIVRKREYEKTIIPAQLLCFGEVESKVVEIAENERMQVRTSVSLRNLIEYLAARPTKGELHPSLDDVDRLLAIMHETTNFGMMSDAVHFNMDDPEVGMLPSGRIGFTSSLFSERMVPFSHANTRADIDNKLDGFANRFDGFQPMEVEEDISEEITQIIETHDAAFLADWGISWTNLNLIFHSAVLFCVQAEASVITMPETEFLEKLIAEAKIPEGQAISGLEKLALSPREAYLKAPEGFANSEVFPWKYNREFSLTRRFIIRHYDSQDKPLLSWGFRGATAARHQLDYLLRGGRLNNGGPEIKKLIGGYTDERGTDFRIAVRDWLKLQPGFKVIDYEVAIEPGGPLNAEKSYGDVDVLVLHEPSRTILSIECKNTTQAKNIHEMKTEMDRYLGRDGKKGMVHKHIERDEWLNHNTDQLQKLFKLSEVKSVRSVMVSSQVIPTPYIKEEALPMAIIAFPELKRNGTSLLF